MNLLGHTLVADATGTADQEFLLGAVLPDLVSIAHVRLDRNRLGGRLADGVICHTRTDAVFHGHPLFVQGAGTIRRELVERGLSNGSARAIGHIGWELLLDGTLVGTAAETAFRSAMELLDRTGDAVVVAQSDRWRRFLSNAHRMDGALHYDDPRWVSDRLHGMLDARSRLAFAASDIPVVTEVLTAHVDAIEANADAVLEQVTAAVSADARR